MKLVIAEKPSVAITIAKVIGANKRNDGYYEGNGYKVSWCVGHLVQMASPEAYDEKYTKWNLKDLPIMPDEFKYEVAKNTKKQFGILKKLMADKEVKTIVNACDAGREGELIFRLVYNKANCKKDIKRLWISSMEDKAIKDGMSALKDGEVYDNLYESATARMIADWLVGMNLSRLYSCLYKQKYSVGRVQTPTLSMIATRDETIKNFKKEKYFTVDIDCGGFVLSTERIDDKNVANSILRDLGDNISVDEVIKKEKITKPDRLFDLTSLQRAANRYYGFSAKQTLDYAQSLYEKKLITYPRTDSRFLTGDMKESVNELIDGIDKSLYKNEANFECMFDDKEVSDHHAIIPTSLSLNEDISKLNASEAKIFSLIKAWLLMARMDNLVESTTKLVCKDGDTLFSVNGKSIIKEGFYGILKGFIKKENKEVILPDLEKGDVLSIKSKEVKEKYTTPPKHYTEEALLKAMELAGTDELEKGVEVERKGLGTPATRAGIIENLIYKGYIERDKKNLLVTHKGLALVTVVSDSFKSAKTTAEWEMKLSDIASGKLKKEIFLKNIEDEIKSLIKTYQK